VDFCKLSRSLLKQFILFSEDFRNNICVLKIWALTVTISLQGKLLWKDFYLTTEGNSKKEQVPVLIKRLKRELKK
jgi:hypothetical protein